MKQFWLFVYLGKLEKIRQGKNKAGRGKRPKVSPQEQRRERTNLIGALPSSVLFYVLFGHFCLQIVSNYFRVCLLCSRAISGASVNGAGEKIEQKSGSGESGTTPATATATATANGGISMKWLQAYARSDL